MLETPSSSFVLRKRRSSPASCLPVDGGLSIQLQENIVFELKNYIQENPGLKTFFDGGFGSGDRQ